MIGSGVRGSSITCTMGLRACMTCHSPRAACSKYIVVVQPEVVASSAAAVASHAVRPAQRAKLARAFSLTFLVNMYALCRSIWSAVPCGTGCSGVP